MQKKKKLILAAAGLLAMFSLSACSQNQDIVTMKGSKITVDDFYNEIKTNQQTQQSLQNMIIYQVMEDNYGDKVTDKTVDKKFKEQKEQYGDQFKTLLQQNGLTETSYKKQIKQSLAFEEALKANLKIKDDDLKTVWKTYHPEVEAQIISVSSEEDANKILDELKNGGDFTKIAKEKSTAESKDDGGKVKFDSASTDVPDDVKTAAFKLKDGEVSAVIPVTTSSGYTASGVTSYYIVKMVKNQDKGHDWKPYKKELTAIFEEQKKSDNEFVTSVITKELKKANVKIKDADMKNVLANYLPTETKSSSSTSSSSSKKDSSSSESTKDSSSTEESSSASTEESSSAE